MTNRAAPSSWTCTGKYRLTAFSHRHSTVPWTCTGKYRLAAFSHRHSTVRQGTDSREKYSLMVPSTLRYVLVAHMRLTCRRRLHHRGQPPLTLAPVGTDAGLGAPEAPMVRRHPRTSLSDPTQTHLPRAREDATRARAGVRVGGPHARRHGAAASPGGGRGARGGRAEGGAARREGRAEFDSRMAYGMPSTGTPLCISAAMSPPPLPPAASRLEGGSTSAVV